MKKKIETLLCAYRVKNRTVVFSLLVSYINNKTLLPSSLLISYNYERIDFFLLVLSIVISLIIFIVCRVSDRLTHRKEIMMLTWHAQWINKLYFVHFIAVLKRIISIPETKNRTDHLDFINFQINVRSKSISMNSLFDDDLACVLTCKK